MQLAIQKNFELITTEYVVDEVNEVLKRKFPGKRVEVINLLALLDLKILPVPSKHECGKFISLLRDPKDIPVLTAAVKANVDLLLTGDQDFSTKDIAGVIQVIDAAGFIKHFGK